MADLLSKLNKALKVGGRNTPTGSFRHDNEAEILAAATDLLAKSETGRELLDYARNNNIAMHVLRNKQDYGVMPDAGAVYITCPAGQDMPTVRAVLQLALALREAMHEGDEAMKRPSPRIGRERFLQSYMKKDQDIAYIAAEVSYQLVQATGLSQIIDEIGHMGYGDVYEAYKHDVENAASGGTEE